jgi:hypothetical protein
MPTNKKKTTYTLYLLRNAQGMYYSPRASYRSRAWNKAGKFLTKQQLAAIPPSVKRQAVAIEQWSTGYWREDPT